MARVKARADTVIANARDGVRSVAATACDGCTVITGHARFVDAQTMRVGDERLTAPHIFINVGGRAVGAGPARVCSDVPYLTNTTILALDRVPRAPAWSSAAAISGSNSRRCTGASAPR